MNRAALGNGDIPLWNPFAFGGRPHYADASTQVLYPPNLLLKFLSPQRMFPVSAVFHLWLLAFGSYLLARRLAEGVMPALLAAGGTTLVVIAGAERELAYSSVLNDLAWLPLLVLVTWRSMERSEWLPRPLAVALAVMVMMASPRGGAYVLAAVLAGVGLVVLGKPVAPGGALRAGAALVVLSAGLGAVQLVPTLHLWAATLPYGGLTADVPHADSHHNREWTAPRLSEPVASALRAIDGRVVSVCPSAADAGQLAASGVRTADGYGGLMLADYARFAHVALGGEPQRRVEFAGFARAGSSEARGDLLRLADVDYLLACEDVDPQLWRPVSSPVAGLYRSAQSMPRVFWTCDPEVGACDDIVPAQVLRADQIDGEMLVAVDAPRDGILFFSETFYPVRAARVDGRPVETRKVNVAFTAVPVVAGIHRVELRYDRTPVSVGAGITIASAALWPALLIRSRRARRVTA